MQLIDVHCHFMPAHMPACPCSGAAELWPNVRRDGVIDAILEIGGKPFRKVDNRSWDMSRRIAGMDAMGVGLQVLSPMPELLSYWFDGAAAAHLCNHVNYLIGALVAEAPSRFRGLGMIPMQNPSLAVAMLPEIQTKFGLVGIEIGSNIDGIALGDPRFDPVYEMAEELGLAIFVHALHPVASRLAGWTGAAVPMVGFPIDTAMAAISLIYAGIRERFPKLRIGFSHGGGALVPILHRLNHGWKISNGFEGTMAVAPGVQAAGFFYDSLVYDLDYLRHLNREIAPGNIFLGTDYPYALMEADPGAFLAKSNLAPTEKCAIGAESALRFLGEAKA